MEEALNRFLEAERTSFPEIESKNCSTTEIVSKVAYLIGVPEYHFIPANGGVLDHVLYDKLDKEKNARIIRNLCILRTTIENNYANLNRRIRDEYKGLYSMNETSVPIEKLAEDGIDIARNPKKRLQEIVVDVNKEISNRINNCAGYFPEWIVWDYIKTLFIMPGGSTENGVRTHIREKYYPNKDYYPYRVYINWKPRDMGNILENDRKFLEIIYGDNGYEFSDTSKVTKLDSVTSSNILQFIEDSRYLDIFVDCENVNPYRLAVTLNSLDPLLGEKIKKLVLVNDPNTVKIWKDFGKYVKGYTIEHRMNERLTDSKSLVDGDLMGQVYKEFYRENVDSFIICSSDSDYITLLRNLEEARFMILGEQKNMGDFMKDALNEANVSYAYIENFYSGGTGQDIKERVILEEMEEKVNSTPLGEINLRKLLSSTLFELKIMFTTDEYEQFYKHHIKPVTLEMDEKGNLKIKFKR